MRSPHAAIGLTIALMTAFIGQVAIAMPTLSAPQLSQTPLPTPDPLLDDDGLSPGLSTEESDTEDSNQENVEDENTEGENETSDVFEIEDDDFLTPDPTDPIFNSEEAAAEVGEIQIFSPEAQTPATAIRRQPNGQLLLRSSAFTSSNTTASSGDQTDDIVFVNQATFLVTPKLGPETRLIATAGGGLTRFADEGDNNNYNTLGFSLGVQHRLTERMYGQLGWVNTQLYSAVSGDRTLSDNSARLLIGRQDQLDTKLRLDTAYELRARFTDPSDRSRIGNSLSANLRYDVSPDWQASLGYRLALNDYTQNGRFDTAHRLQAATTYTPTQDTFVTGFASYSFGDSSANDIDLENLSFGLGIGVNLPLF